MEALQEQLSHALVSGLGFYDEYNDFVEFFLQMVVVVANDVDTMSISTPQAGGSRVDREFLFCDKELDHAHLF